MIDAVHIEQKSLSVLLVDDEIEFLAVIKKRMRIRNIEVVTATGGSEAIAILRGKDFDCAVVDLRMQDMNGIEVLKVFKKMARVCSHRPETSHKLQTK